MRAPSVFRNSSRKQKSHLPGLSGGGLYFDSTRTRVLDDEPPRARAHLPATQTAWTTAVRPLAQREGTRHGPKSRRKAGSRQEVDQIIFRIGSVGFLILPVGCLFK